MQYAWRSDVSREIYLNLLMTEMMKAETKEAQFAVGVEWCVQQCRDLIKAGVPSIHFYTNGQARSVNEVAKKIY